MGFLTNKGKQYLGAYASKCTHWRTAEPRRGLQAALSFPFTPVSEFLSSLGILALINLGITLIIFTLMEWRFFWTIFGAANGIGLGCFLVTRTTVKYFYPRFGSDIRIMLAAQPLAALVGSGFGHLFLASYQPFYQTYTTAILFGLPASLVFYFLSRISEAKVASQAAKTEQEKARKHAVQIELRTLQNQIEPHFLFNTLANVSALIDFSPAQAKTLLAEYTEFLRDTMRVSTQTLWPLEDEISMIQRYLRIQQVRFPNIHFSVTMADELGNTRIPPLLLQPLVENAFVHGLSPKGNIGQIDIRCQVMTDNVLEIQVSDNGVGLEQNASRQHGLSNAPSQTSGEHVALNNIRARLNSHYGDNASLTLTNANPGVISTIQLPLHSTGETP